MDASTGVPSKPASAGMDVMSAPPHLASDADGSREEKYVPGVTGSEVAYTHVSAAGEEEPPQFLIDWWVTSIRESISAEDLCNIRFRRSTIQAATARLGGGRQGNLQLLKLIFTWVQNNHQRPRDVMEEAAGLHGQVSSSPPGANPVPGYEFPAGGQHIAAGGGTSLTPLIQQPSTPPARAAGQHHLFHQSSSKSSVVVSRQLFSPGFGGQYAGAASHLIMAGVEASATKEKQKDDSVQRLAAYKRQGAKAEEKLRFLLQKELKQSDVGELGRIVLPKMEAEVHLPELKTKYGISIPMEDIGTSRVWNMQYRFWSDNKSRMYVLGNTGEFVRSNELQQGDFIVIYSDVKSGKYLIQGVKVKPPDTTTTDSAHLVRDTSEVDLDEVDKKKERTSTDGGSFKSKL
ncbi:hypothetical protein BDA96_02G167800 [Sorghum bicolor]|uniref:TF-B3 domain-containing protein n=2 Tax=Sorghum bicolor TaxID=4558 RepID=A0A1B6QBR4_SORBI|nr:regulatory protein viviparous-1-like [Sorghum bicolor]XP_021308715.1 regulatory protein viviparous-1-like [Sorghum bicolor]KAG0543180.1 hypothetical protein BDA96_02G167800 [Sorghum bicolor]KXG35344.1 hypothetical protein SORBI_3002G161600 [Sorghum bicolor]OQU89229.1 hypothetical protein SORBI_3002G161600 [Sorghum bicolor]|eukprot:XP_021308714.1 regulatory protein viviparous-1-like [Sorghum bicolor]